jgi:hypothetical protein
LFFFFTPSYAFWNDGDYGINAWDLGMNDTEFFFFIIKVHQHSTIALARGKYRLGLEIIAFEGL